MTASIREDGKRKSVERGWRWTTLGRRPGLLFALELVAVVAVLDYVTGYEVRLAILYLLPIALATWTGGMPSGALTATIAGCCWLISFYSNNIYAQHIFYYWEGVVLMATFIVFVVLLARLRSALARADERFLRVLQGLYAGVYVVEERSGKVLYANRRLRRMIGADPPPMKVADIERRFAVVAPMMEEHVLPRQAGGSVDFMTVEARDEAGERWYLIQSGSIPWEHNQNATLKVVTDITEQKQVQALKRQHQEALNQSARLSALAEIASTLAHEINQPLMAVASYNEACLRMLSAHPLDIGQVRQALEKCRTQAVRAGQVISRTRGFIRKRDAQPMPGNIEDAMREAVESLESELQDAGVTVSLQSPGALPQAVFDRTLIVQVIVNLLHNAIDAVRSVDPSRRLLSLAVSLDDDAMLAVSVSDQGNGIPAESESLLYTPFFTTKVQGIGLGLCICRSIIEAHAGRLWHTTNDDGGMTFHFALPREESGP